MHNFWLLLLHLIIITTPNLLHENANQIEIKIEIQRKPFEMPQFLILLIVYGARTLPRTASI